MVQKHEFLELLEISGVADQVETESYYWSVKPFQ